MPFDLVEKPFETWELDGFRLEQSEYQFAPVHRPVRGWFCPFRPAAHGSRSMVRAAFWLTRDSLGWLSGKS